MFSPGICEKFNNFRLLAFTGTPPPRALFSRKTRADWTPVAVVGNALTGRYCSYTVGARRSRHLQRCRPGVTDAVSDGIGERGERGLQLVMVVRNDSGLPSGRQFFFDRYPFVLDRDVATLGEIFHDAAHHLARRTHHVREVLMGELVADDIASIILFGEL